MVEHFQAVTRHRIGGRAKAMVVTGSRLEAVRYKQSFDRYVREKGYAIRSLVAFSGAVEDDRLPGVTYTEEQMNDGLREKELPERFAAPGCHVLLVAEKLPDRLRSAAAAIRCTSTSGWPASRRCKTLSRLNRIHPLKEDTFVLDFRQRPRRNPRRVQDVPRRRRAGRGGRPGAPVRRQGRARRVGRLSRRRDRPVLHGVLQAGCGGRVRATTAP